MKILPTLTTLGLALAGATTLAACGSSAAPAVTAPSSTTSTPTAAASTSASSSSSSTSRTTSTASSTTSPTASATSSTTTAATTTGATTTTRTETGPAFVGTTPTGGAAVGHDLAAAIAVLSHHGYVPVTTATYNAGDTLRVLIGRRPGTTGERAFFFDQTIYLGTDASAPSAQITLADQNDTEVTLNYGIYRPGALAAGGERPVRFVLDMGQLNAMDPLPSVAQRR